MLLYFIFTFITYFFVELFGITQFTLNSTTGKLFIQNAVDREVVKQLTLTALVSILFNILLLIHIEIIYNVPLIRFLDHKHSRQALHVSEIY